MKGGRTAPRNGHRTDGGCAVCGCFNEGGADCPPKPSAGYQHKLIRIRFNEGGADCPPKQNGQNQPETAKTGLQ